MIKSIPGELRSKMEDHGVSARYKEKHDKLFSRMLGDVVVKIQVLMKNSRAIRVLHSSLVSILKERGIEKEEEW